MIANRGTMGQLGARSADLPTDLLPNKATLRCRGGITLPEGVRADGIVDSCGKK